MRRFGILFAMALLLCVASIFGGEGTKELEEITTWELIRKGGWLMVPIGLCSLIALAYAFERFINLRLRVIMPPRLVAALEERLESQRYGEAKKLCREDDSPFGRIMLAGLRELDEDWSRVENAIVEAGAREVAVFRQNVRPLRIVSEIAPLLGLLGTVQGMMGAFQKVSASAGQLGKTEMFAGDIFLALSTTAAGLTVAIPALFLYYVFVGRIDKIILRLDTVSENLLERIRDARKKAVKANAAGKTSGKGGKQA